MIKFPKLTITVLFAILLLPVAYSQSSNLRVENYINNYKELAISEMLRTGVPASVTLAQGILETAGGQSDLASIANNHFGIKCKSEWTGERMYHDDDAKNECFRKYASVEDSYKDHSDFLKTRPMYAFLFKLDPTDFEGWAKGLKKAGYATSSTYAQHLIKIIVENNLQSYTLVAMQKKVLDGNSFSTSIAVLNQPESVEDQKPIVSNINQHTSFLIENDEKGKNERYPINAIFIINNLKVIYAPNGTSLLALANNYNVGLKKLLEFNELEQKDILTSNQLIFLQKKSKKGIKEIHIVEENETLHDIAQKEGIQLETMMEYNGLQKGMQPATGEKIYLKFPAPASPKLATNVSTKNNRNL